VRQLRLAQEEAGLRPRLTVSLRTVVYHYRPPNPGSKYEQAAIVFDVTNDGRSAAHNVSCEVRLDERHLELDDLHGQNRNLFAPHIGPSATVPHAVNVGVLSVGPTVARYRVVCDEVGESRARSSSRFPKGSGTNPNRSNRSGAGEWSRTGPLKYAEAGATTTASTKFSAAFLASTRVP
jgi:hypothetical protein